MARKNISWKTKGMNRDMSVSAFNPEFSFENINMRLSSNEGNTLMSWVNERGTKEITLSIYKNGFNVGGNSSNMYLTSLIGVPIGTAIINHQLVVFTYDANDSYGVDNYIYVLNLSKDGNSLEGKILYAGYLNMDSNHPLETLVSYESENVQKVYWTDGKSENQPRVLNIKSSRMPTGLKPSFFDFVPELNLRESVYVYKMFGSGEFPAGVIQYAFTYYNKYGQESNIFHVTPLQYISYVDRGGSPDSKIANSFKIEIYHLDSNFDYLRIYSILRTSKDATPLCKRIQDIEITSSSAVFIDNGLQGETIDPTELLYKGGERISASTLEQKDGTLFLGNIKVTRPLITVKNSILTANGVSKSNPIIKYNVSSETIWRPFTLVSKQPFVYANTLSCPSSDTYEGIAGFKSREYYRLGVQFQYKDGKWSEPCWIGDCKQTTYPRFMEKGSEQFSKGAASIAVPGFKYTISQGILATLYSSDYRRARPVMAMPNFTDRTILCQGVGCPTVYRLIDRYADPNKVSDSEKGRLYAQSSWLFRVPVSFGSSIEDGDASNGGGKVSYSGTLKTQFDNPMSPLKPAVGSSYKVSPFLRDTEIMGYFDTNNSFIVDACTATVHSPDVEFDTAFDGTDFTNCIMDLIGSVGLEHTYGDISIQTSTPAIGSDAAGFIHRSVSTDGAAALISAPFYNDYLVDDLGDDKYEAYMTQNPAVYFPVYMWHKNGSLNNDVNRTNRSAELLKKVISNYRLGGDTAYRGIYSYMDYEAEDIQLFNSDELNVSKVAGNVYMGNIDTMLTPTKPSRHYFVGSPYSDTELTDYFNYDSYCYLGLKDPNNTESKSGVWTWAAKDGYYTWDMPSSKYSNIGDKVKGLCQWREPISMKYKSTAHLVAKTKYSIFGYGSSVISNNSMPVVEIRREYSKDHFFGGTSEEALKAATWIPCGPSVYFDGSTSIDLHYKWGDTYFQRVECLKTYPFTHEDKNQVVEIASFMVETRVNMDGRYDKNRAQTSNLNMTPQNFNLINPVYSQMDNFFSYKTLDEEDYRNTSYPNNITWTKTKENGADIDLWTNITLANILELDGNKGEITKLTRSNNQLLAFQDKGISQILYNENTQISTTEGVPIEIANSEKVQGKRYLSDTVGCSNKWSIAQTPVGIYFMDSNEKSIYLFNGQLNNISTTGGFNSWCKQHIPSANDKWNPEEFGNFVTYYDKLNQDVLFINKNTALAYSEKFSCFTSFYDYGSASYLDYLDDVGIWIKDGKTWRHQAGEYCQFFDDNKPFSMTLVANQEPQLDKIFTNLEFRACVNGEGTYDESTDKFVPSLPFDTLEAWDEYQHGIISLNNKNKGNRFTHGLMSGILARKFRIWGCDIPRDNVTPDAVTEAPLGIKRFKARPLDRIRNTWAYLKLGKNAAEKGKVLSKTEVHDIMASYFA